MPRADWIACQFQETPGVLALQQSYRLHSRFFCGFSFLAPSGVHTENRVQQQGTRVVALHRLSEGDRGEINAADQFNNNNNNRKRIEGNVNQIGNRPSLDGTGEKKPIPAQTSTDREFGLSLLFFPSFPLPCSPSDHGSPRWPRLLLFSCS